MLKIDSEKMIIAMTRGDTANIVFSAVDDEGKTYDPVTDDVLRFAVAKKVGADPVFEPIRNRFVLGAIHRGWIPSLISKKHKISAIDYISCESHRDKLIHWLLNE